MPHRVICFGEILWDFLPKGKEPGGAPLNVTYHLNKTGVPAALISRLGKDELGEEFMRVLREKKVPAVFISSDPDHDTGKVFADTNQKEEVTYRIVEPVAWDFIEWKPEFQEAVGRADYFVFGSLACRNEYSRNSLLKLLEAANIRVFDVNLRPPHFQKETIVELMKKAELLKLNHNELELIAGWFGNETDEIEQMKLLQEKFSINTVVVTRGARGACVLTNGKWYEQSGFKVQVVDTVGSGDAFLAGFLSSLLNKHDPQYCLELACALGATVARYAGACPDYAMEEALELI
jgi:fructokinase